MREVNRLCVYLKNSLWLSWAWRRLGHGPLSVGRTYTHP
jgi:hypothetical protein